MAANTCAASSAAAGDMGSRMGRKASKRWGGDGPLVKGGWQVPCVGRRGLVCVRRAVCIGGGEEEGAQCVGCHHFHQLQP